MNITKRVLAFVLVLFLMFGNVTPAMATGLETEETVAVPETQVPAELSSDPAADSTLTIAEAIALGASKAHDTYTEGKYYVTGVITEVYNTKYGNMRITDGTDILTVYGTYSADGSTRYDGMDVKPVAGDTVTVYGIIGQYNGTSQVKNGWIVGHTPAAPAETEPAATEPAATEPAATEPSGDEEAAAATLKFSVADNRISYSADQQVWKNGDLVLTNDKGDSTSDIYDIVAKGYGEVRLYQGSNVKIQYPGMTKIVFYVDDYKDTYVSALQDSISNLGTVTVDGLVVTLELSDVTDGITYQAAAQHRLTEIAVYGTGTAVNPGEPDPTEPAPTEPAPTEPAPTEPEVTEPAPTEPAPTEPAGPTTPHEIVDAAYGLGEGETLEGTYTLTGKIISVDTEYNEQYQNITVTIAVEGRESKPIQCYRLKGEGAETLEVGDTITVTGKLKNYYGTIEFDQGCTLDAVVKAPVQEPGEAPTATITFEDGNRVEWDAEHQLWQSNGITVTNNKGGSTSNVADYTNPARFYKGSTVKVEYPGMTKIVFTCAGSVKYVLAESDIANLGTVTTDGFAVTLELAEAADAIEFVAASNQVRVSKIEVYAVASEEPAEPTPGSEEMPIEVTFEMNEEFTAGDATVTVPANTTYYFFAYNIAGMVLTVNGENPQLMEGMPRMPVIFTVTNNTDAEAEFALHIAFPVGHQMNPEELYWLGQQHTSLTAGDTDGYYYTYTVENDGTLTFGFAEGTGEVADIVVTNMNTYAQRSIFADGINGIVSVDVTAGDVLNIQVVALPDANWNIPALELDWNVNYPLGSELNPQFVEFVMNEDYTAGTANVAVPARTTRYFQAFGIGGMMLHVNGEAYQLLEGNPRMPVVFTIVNDTDVDWEYVLTVTYPVGTQMNPAPVNVHNVGENEEYEGNNWVWLEADNWNGYIYGWTAPAAGTLTIAMENGLAGWAYSIYNLNTYEMTEIHYSCDLPAVSAETINVNAGDVIQIMVNTCGEDSSIIPGGQVMFRATYTKIVGTEENPYMVEFVWNDEQTEATATVTVPANTVYYCQAYRVAGMLLSIDGGEPIMLTSDGMWYPSIFTVPNDTEAEKEFTLVLTTVPGEVGSDSNPAPLAIGENITELEAGTEGYIYSFTASDKGLLTITVSGDSWTYSVRNVTTYEYRDTHWYDDEVVVASETLEVNAGDKVEVYVNTYDPENPWTAPAGTVTVTASMEYAPGTAYNPIVIYGGEEMVHNIVEGNDSVHYSFYGIGGMEMIFWTYGENVTVEIGGVSYEAVPYEQTVFPVPASNPRMPVDVVVKNADDWAVDFEIMYQYPLGHDMNPHNPTLGKKNTIEIEAGSQGHHVRFQSNVSGFLEFTMNTKTGWTYVINNMTSGIYGDMHWSDDEVIATKSYVAVTEGDIVDIIVNTYDPENPWTAPEGKIAFTPKLITAYQNEVVSGKSLTLKYINPDNGKTVTNSKVTWELYMYERDEWGDIVLDEETWQKKTVPVPAEIATIKAGKLTTAKGIADATEIVVEATYGETKNFYNITIRPAATSIRLEMTEWNYRTEESTVVEDANGQTFDWILNYEDLQLHAITDPDGASDKLTWKSSNTKILKVHPTNDGYCWLEPVYNAKTGKYGYGKVTITATTADGSNKKVSTTINVSALADYIDVLPKDNQWTVGSGKSLTMIANVPSYATNKAVDWSVKVVEWNEEAGEWIELDTTIATINAKGVLTAAKNLQQSYQVKVIATAKDGGGAEGYAMITIAPATKKVVVSAPAQHDISNGLEFYVSAKAISADESFEHSDIKWTVSGGKAVSSFYYCTFWNEETWEEEDGICVVLTGKTGKVSLTATANDGTKVSAKATVNVVKAPSIVELDKNNAYLAAGKSLTLKATVGTYEYDEKTDRMYIDQNVTDKTVIWDAKVVKFAEITNEWGEIYTDYVEVEGADIGLSIKAGKLSMNTKKLNAYIAETGEYPIISVTATAKMADAWGEFASDRCIVQVAPATTKADIIRGSVTNVITNKTLTIDDDATLVLGAIPTPDNAHWLFSWKSSNTNVATVVENMDGSVTVKPAGKLGTATITATAVDGTGKSAKVTVKVISKVDSLTIDTTKFALAGTKAGKSFDLNKLLTVAPANASNKKVTWSIADWDAEIAKANKITLSATGKLTAKMAVTEPVTFTVIAKAADGLGAVAYAELTVTPAATKVNIMVNGEVATGTQEVAIDSELVVSATSDPELAASVYTWKTSNAKVAKIVENEDGTVSIVGVKTGSAKITVTAADGSGKTATITVKVVKKKQLNYDVTLWVSGQDGMAEMTQEMIDAFEAAHPSIKINATIEGVSEGDAGSLVIANVAAAPDIYCFAQDQLARLIQVGALEAPSADIAAAVKAENDASSVSAASLAGNLYAYPMTSDNGYFMYYDKSIISEEDAESLEAMIAACEANGVEFRFSLENAWFNASFFFGAGCHSVWTTDENGQFISVDDNFNSEMGLIAMKGMQKLTSSPCYNSNADIFDNAGVVVTGVWNYWAAQNHFGENLGATDLPSFEVDGQSYHLGSFSGNKLMGVKPQEDHEKAAVLALLAQWLTNEENQLKRYELFNFGPSNLKAQASPAVQSDISLAALLKQNNYAQPQGQIHGAWWDTARRLGVAAREADSVDALKAALEEYEAVIKSLFS